MMHFYTIKFSSNLHLTDAIIIDTFNERFTKWILVREKWDTNPHWHILDLNYEERTPQNSLIYAKRKLNTKNGSLSCVVKHIYDDVVSYILKEGNVIHQNIFSEHELEQCVLQAQIRHTEVERKKATRSGSFTAMCVDSYIPQAFLEIPLKDHIMGHVLSCLDGNSKGIDKFITTKLYYAIFYRHFPDNRNSLVLYLNSDLFS